MDSTSSAMISGSAFTGSTLVSWSTDSLIWILVVGFLVAFVLSFAVGANDVANSFGTTVGAKVLTLKQACVLATICETLGAVLLGAKVGETIRKGIIDVTTYNEIENGAVILMLGELSAMFGAAIWQLIATLVKLPVSGTHSIVGACIGFSLVAAGANGVNWTKLGLIVASWFLSPVLSGLMSVSLFIALNRFVINKSDPLPIGLRLLPFFYGFAFGINIFSILYAGAPLIGLDQLKVWEIVLVALASMGLVSVVVHFAVIPRVRRRLASHTTGSVSSDSKAEGSLDKFITGPDSGYETPMEKQNVSTVSSLDVTMVQRVDALHSDDAIALSSQEEDDPFPKEISFYDKKKNSLLREENMMELGGLTNVENMREPDPSDEDLDEDEDSPVIRILFSPLQVLTACFASFAHGGNDVSNAIGPLIALWIIFWSGQVAQKAFTPWYLLLYGGVGICIGLWLLGRRVIETIGCNLTKVTPSRGFCIELMTAVTVLVASNAGLPVSTTHCKVGAVVSIGWARSRAAVDWKLVGNIALAWFITVPVSGLLSAGAMWVLMQVAL